MFETLNYFKNTKLIGTDQLPEQKRAGWFQVLKDVKLIRPRVHPLPNCPPGIELCGQLHPKQKSWIILGSPYISNLVYFARVWLRKSQAVRVFRFDLVPFILLSSALLILCLGLPRPNL